VSAHARTPSRACLFFLPLTPSDAPPGLAPSPGAGIRHLISKRVKSTTPSSAEEYYDKLQEYVDELKTMPVAEQQDAANEQHYEVPTEYFTTVLGEHRKYSSCLYSRPGMTLEEAEVEMMELTCQRAQLATGFDGDILELGCGWGSLSLFMAHKLPKARITAISNSRTQKEYIDGQARTRGIKNLTVKTQDVVTAEFEGESFDRVVSIEMFEHMKNYETLLARISSWLRPGGMLFVHIFVHAKGLVCVWQNVPASRFSSCLSPRGSSRLTCYACLIRSPFTMS
jgi:cyclopropane-fatty-acyl-phospholipid synthase